MLVALCSDKGSPGVTTAALALAAAWGEPAVVVEADPYGGDLALRVRTSHGEVLPETPTVLSLATAARTAVDAYLVARYGQSLNDQVLVVPGFGMAEQGSSVPDWSPAAAAMAASVVPVFADVGRLHSQSPLVSVAAAADVLMVVVRPGMGALVRLRERLIRLVPAVAETRGGPPRVFVLVVTRGRYGRGDVADVAQLLQDTAVGPFLAGVGYLVLDPGGVGRLETGADPKGKSVGRTGLMKSARRVVGQLESLIPAQDQRTVAAGVGQEPG